MFTSANKISVSSLFYGGFLFVKKFEKFLKKYLTHNLHYATIYVFSRDGLLTQKGVKKMNDMVVITLRPVSGYSVQTDYEFSPVRYPVNLYSNDFNRAVREAIRLAKKSFKNCPVNSFDVVSIEVV